MSKYAQHDYENKRTLDSVIKTGAPPHLTGRTIQQIIDSDTDGSNIMFLLRYRAGSGSSKIAPSGIPYAYFTFDDEVNASLDLLLYANKELLKQFVPCFTQGQLKLKLKQIEAETKQRKRQEARQALIDAMNEAERFQALELELYERYVKEAKDKHKREMAYSGTWGGW